MKSKELFDPLSCRMHDALAGGMTMPLICGRTNKVSILNRDEKCSAAGFQDGSIGIPSSAGAMAAASFQGCRDL
jgi:hypothetical protein